MKVVRCVLSGSYRRDVAGLEREYHELVTTGCQVLSPHRLDFTDPEALFVKDQAEVDFSPAEIERHHLLAVQQADFVWLHCPEGYIGPSAALEIGYALATHKPVFSRTMPADPGLQPFVEVVPSVFMAIQTL